MQTSRYFTIKSSLLYLASVGIVSKTAFYIKGFFDSFLDKTNSDIASYLLTSKISVFA